MSRPRFKRGDKVSINLSRIDNEYMSDKVSSLIKKNGGRNVWTISDSVALSNNIFWYTTLEDDEHNIWGEIQLVAAKQNKYIVKGGIQYGI